MLLEGDEPAPSIVVSTAWLLPDAEHVDDDPRPASRVLADLATDDATVHELLRDVYELPGGTMAYVRRLVAAEPSLPDASDGQGLVVEQILADVLVVGAPGCWLLDACWPDLLRGDELAAHVHALLEGFRLDTDGTPGAG